jgi:hypothetical protein
MVLLGVKAGGAEGQVQLSPYAVPLLGEQTGEPEPPDQGVLGCSKHHKGIAYLPAIDAPWYG